MESVVREASKAISRSALWLTAVSACLVVGQDWVVWLGPLCPCVKEIDKNYTSCHFQTPLKSSVCEHLCVFICFVLFCFVRSLFAFYCIFTDWKCSVYVWKCTGKLSIEYGKDVSGILNPGHQLIKQSKMRPGWYTRWSACLRHQQPVGMEAYRPPLARAQ